jgi:hypothetical protein
VVRVGADRQGADCGAALAAQRRERLVQGLVRLLAD